MSEGDRAPTDRNPGQYGGGGIGSAQPRQPNTLTQSKVLSIVSKNQQNQTSTQVADQTVKAEAAQTAPKQAEGTMRQLSLPVAPSGLSANAAVFVPKAMQKPQPVPQGYPDDGFYYGGQEGEYGLDQEGLEYYLGNNFGELTLEDTYETDQPYYSSNYSQASIEERFDLALKILTTNPSNHEEYLKPICQEIVQTSAYDKVVPTIVENLYAQCINEDNFRYIGARVCQYLNSSLKMEPNFIKRFVKRCQVDFDKRGELIAGNPDDQKRLRGLGMLLAEIFLNVETTGSDGTPQRLGFLPSILIKMVKTLLTEADDANIKCGCQMMKLSGSLLEEVVKSSPDDCIQFENLFDSLKKLADGGKISENAKFHVDKIVKLKDDCWDSSFSAGPSTAYNPYAQNQYYGGQQQAPVYYDSPGKESDESVSHLLTEEEEADFLAWQSGYDSYKPDSEMGFEMEEAYEEFLKQQAPAAPPTKSHYSNSKKYQYNQMAGGASTTSGTGPANVSQHHHHHHHNHNQYQYYNQQQQQQPTTHNHHQHGHYGGSSGGAANYYPHHPQEAANHYQQQQYNPPYDPHYQQQQQQQPGHYVNNQYNQQQQQHLRPQMPVAQQQQQQQPQQPPYHPHQQQYQQSQQHQQHHPQQQPQHFPPNDQYHYRR